MSISFDGIGEQTVTFRAGHGVAAGHTVSISAADTVQDCILETAFAGVAMTDPNDGLVAVKLHGFVTLPYSGMTAPAVGWSRLYADGNGGVKKDSGATGLLYLVTSVDTAAKTVSFFM